MKAELNDYDEVQLTERFKELRPPQLWKARFRLLPKIAAFVVIQIALFFRLFWWFGHRSHRNHSSAATKPAVVDATPRTK
jgi:hypothetical protein